VSVQTPISGMPTPSGTPGAPKLLEVRDIVTRFTTDRGSLTAVNGVSLSLERGRTLGVVGESGSGKSVLSRSIMGLLPRSNTERSGKVIFEGKEISGLNDSEYRELWGDEMAMIFQDPMTALNPVMKVGLQITESLRFHLNMSKSDAKDTAVALACGPKLLFADEPTTALDVTVQAQILDLLAEQQRERYMGMILVTHDLGVVAGRADEIAVMYAGQIVEQAPTALLFSEMKMPYTEALMSAIPKLTDASHTRLAAIGGRPPDLVNPPKGCAFSPRCPYVQPRCHEESPVLTPSPTAPEHLFACFYPIGSPETEEVRLRIAAQRLMATAPEFVAAPALGSADAESAAVPAPPEQTEGM